MKVGFIGLGNMGGPMAGWILKAGFPLVVYDIREEAAASLLAQGAAWADSPRAVAEQCEVICTCVPGPPQMEAVTLGPNGILEGIQPDAIYIDHTTNSPELVRRVGAAVKDHKGHMLDAPVDGGREGSLEGNITVFVGGDEAVFEKVRPVLESFSTSIAWVGALGTGTITKIVHNALGITLSFLLGECLTLGGKAGVEMPRLLEAFRLGSTLKGNSSFNRRLPATLFRGNFEARFALNHAYKDIRLAAELAAQQGAPVRMITLCEQEMREAMNRGWGDKDRVIALTLQEERTQVKIRDSGY